MNAKRLLQHYERIAEAPDAVARLRTFILDLAVRGKLVPQDESDERASELLNRIGKEKAAIARRDGFKEFTGDLSRDAGSFPYEIPAGWTWCYLDDFAAIARGGSPRPIESFLTKDVDGIPWIKIGDANRGSIYIESTAEKIHRGGLSKTRMVEPGDLLLSNSMSFGFPYITRIRGCIHDGWLVLRLPESLVDKLYIHLMLCSDHAKAAFSQAAAGAVVQNLNADKARQLAVPLPPLAEQHRIVAKVDELMGLCDQLDAARVVRETRRDRLAVTSLVRLNAPDPNTFQADARFALDALPALTARPDQIKQLRQTILNLAVRGKLEPQDLADEPASELLKRIEEERRQLVETRRRLRSRDAPSVGEASPPFDLSNGWQWARFAEVAAIQSNLVDPRDYQAYPHIAPDNIESGTGRLLAYETIANSGVFSAKHLFEPGCLLYSKIRPALAKVTPVDFKGLCSADMYPVWPFINRRYLQQFMLTEVFVRQSVSEDNRVAMPKINQEALSKILVAVPPLAEQHRIVAKVDALMVLCDKLEASLAAAAGTRLRLLDALLAESLAPVQTLAMEAAE